MNFIQLYYIYTSATCLFSDTFFALTHYICVGNYLLPNDCILAEDRKLVNVAAHECADHQAPKSQISELSSEALRVSIPQGSSELYIIKVLTFD